MERVGWVDCVLVREIEGDEYELIDGHLRQSLGGSIPALVLDIDETEAAFVLATHDPIAAMAGTEKDILSELVFDFEGLANLDGVFDGMLELPSLIEETSDEPIVDSEDEATLPSTDEIKLARLTYSTADYQDFTRLVRKLRDASGRAGTSEIVLWALRFAMESRK